MKNPKDRRHASRWPVAVLVKCQMSAWKDDAFESEMWAKDVNQDGMKLEWARGLVPAWASNGKSGAVSRRYEDATFARGRKVTIQDLFYDDAGSPPVEGRICWARRAPSSDNWCLGIRFTGAGRRSKASSGAFQDFLTIVQTAAPDVHRFETADRR
jgi:hypothetical protein